MLKVSDLERGATDGRTFVSKLKNRSWGALERPIGLHEDILVQHVASYDPSCWPTWSNFCTQVITSDIMSCNGHHKDPKWHYLTPPGGHFY